MSPILKKQQQVTKLVKTRDTSYLKLQMSGPATCKSVKMLEQQLFSKFKPLHFHSTNNGYTRN